jgi:hypothetical protein
MTPERWQHVKQALAKALELAPAEREVFLENSYAANPALRDDLGPLLASEQRLRGEFLEPGDLAAAAAALIPPDENFWIGRRVGPYQVVKQIGAGGMAEV